MQAFICTTCGTQYEPSETPPAACQICEEERQYVRPTGQNWTTLPKLRETCMATVRFEGELIAIGTSPAFGIGQRALLVRTPEGNILWDCISLIDDALIEIIKGLGGLKAIAISHPHYYTTMTEWSAAFGDIPVYVHAADRQWVMRSANCVEYWEGDTREISPGVTLVRSGGHFEGGTVLHWAGGCGGKGALLTGDLLQVTADRKFVSFMWSYPNFIPLGAKAVEAVAGRVRPWPYEAIYGAFWNLVIPENAKEITERSVSRHIEALERSAP